MKNQLGIWLDSDKALIVTEKDGEYKMDRIESEIEHFHIHGGYGSNVKYAAQDAVSESKLLARRNQQTSRYFDRIIDQIKNYDSIAIFGPGEIKNKFKQVVDDHYLLSDKVVTLQTSDSMTDNQVVAQVRDYYNNQK